MMSLIIINKCLLISHIASQNQTDSICYRYRLGYSWLDQKIYLGTINLNIILYIQILSKLIAFFLILFSYSFFRILLFSFSFFYSFFILFFILFFLFFFHIHFFLILFFILFFYSFFIICSSYVLNSFFLP